MTTIIGKSNIDLITYCNNLPVHGETVYGYDFIPLKMLQVLA